MLGMAQRTAERDVVSDGEDVFFTSLVLLDRNTLPVCKESSYCFPVPTFSLVP